LNQGWTRLDSAWFQRLNPTCVESSSNVAFSYNSRRYSVAFGSFVDTRTIQKLITMGEEKLVRNACHQMFM